LAAAKGALYRETLQAPGMTNRIFNRHKRVCADPVHTNSVTLAFIPQESALCLRATQPTMASRIGYGKPELSTLLESGTFYFALTPELANLSQQNEKFLIEQSRKFLLTAVRLKGWIDSKWDKRNGIGSIG
jgi:hypothetical protein